MRISKLLLGLVGISVLLAMGSCVSTYREKDPVLQAINTGDLDAIKKAVKDGLDVNKKIGRTSLLVRAAIQNRDTIVEFLLENGATDVDEALGYGYSRGNSKIYKLLLAHGADPNGATYEISDILKKQGLVGKQKVDKILELTDQKYNSPQILLYCTPDEYDTIITGLKIDIGAALNRTGQQILHLAAARFDVDLVKSLVAKKDVLNSTDNNGHTALFYAITAYGPSIDWNAAVVETDTVAGLKFIGDMPFYSNPRDLQGKQVSIVFELLSAGININKQDKYGWTVLHFAAAAYPAGLSELLVEKGADANLKTLHDRTAAQVLSLRKLRGS